MNNSNDILNELKDLNSSLPALNPPYPYIVPDGYFEELAASVLAKIKGELTISASEELQTLSPLLAGFTRKMPYAIPQNYFESANLSFITEAEELPINLASLDKTMPFEIPFSYFETLPQIILARVNKPKAKVISISKSWMRVAIAAMITGIIALSGYLYFNNNNSISVDNPQWVAKTLKNVETKELDEFIQMTDVSIAKNIPAPQANAAEVKALLQDVSNEELETFLEDVPTEDEEIILLN